MFLPGRALVGPVRTRTMGEKRIRGNTSRTDNAQRVYSGDAVGTVARVSSNKRINYRSGRVINLAN